MADEIYSVKTSVLDHGKNVKGTLVVFLKGYEFNGSKKVINWEKTSVIRGNASVKNFILRSQKPYIVFCQHDEYSPMFAMNPDQADELEEKISEFRELLLEKRAAEEARRRHEEEVRRHHEEEEARRHCEELERRCREEKERMHREEEARRHREEEEARRHCEELERKRREEDERKRREEEEHRHREEEEARRHCEELERRCREEEARKRREKEEHRAREACVRKIEDRENRLAQEIAKAQSTATDVCISKPKDASVRKAWTYFVDNPYRILGISVTATSEEADSSLEKIKKLTRLNAVASFKGRFELNGLEKPARDLSIVQNALTILKEIKYKWFWFAAQEACIAWQNERFRDELFRDGEKFGTYDLFLANYVYALIFDPTFMQPDLWKPVFMYYCSICRDSGNTILMSRFNQRERETLSVSEIALNFKAEIFKPVKELCNTREAIRILRLYIILQEIADGNINDLREAVMLKLTDYFITAEETACTVINKYADNQYVSSAELGEIKKAGENYLKEADSAIQDTLAAVKDNKVRYEMIKESYCHAVWQLMFAFYKADDIDEAVLYANKCYLYCDENDRRAIRNTFGLSALKSTDSDAIHAEWDVMGDNYYEGNNGYAQDYCEAFKWYEKAAKAGNRYSQNSLGVCYQKGYGTEQSDYLAAQWFERAYENGNPDGAFNLARCFASGNGVVQDKEKALGLYFDAANSGHPRAAEAGNRLLKLMKEEQKLHRLNQHQRYDLGYQEPKEKAIIAEVTLNCTANVYLMEKEEYEKYLDCKDFTYYGGRGVNSPYGVKIPHAGFWYLIIDNGDNDMTGIVANVHISTLNV